MRNEKSKAKKIAKPSTTDEDFFGRLWDESWIYIKTIVDVVHEPVLILNDKLCVMAANDPFYRMFQVDSKNTEDKLVYKLGNGSGTSPHFVNSLKKSCQIIHSLTVFKSRIRFLL